MKLEALAQKADTNVPPEQIVRKTKKKLAWCAPPAAATAITTLRFTHQPLLVLFIALATALYITYDLLLLVFAAAERKAAVEAELPFAATVLAMAAGHTTPTNTLRNMANKPSFKSTTHEYHNMVKQARLNHTTQANAALMVAQTHPSQRFQAFLRTVSAAERGVGDPQASLTDLAAAELQNLEHQAELASEKLGVASSAVLMVFAVLPLTLTVFSMIANQPGLLTLLYILTAPSLVLVDQLIEQAYPRILKPATQNPPAITIVAGPLAAAAIFLALKNTLQPHTLFAACLVAATLPAAIHYHLSAKRKHLQLLSSLPQLSRDIAEEAKKGLPPRLALAKALASKKYPENLKHTLRADHKPKIAQAYIDVLSEAEKIGADPERLEQIAETFNHIANTHSSYRSKSSFFRITAYASAAILAAASAAITTTMKRLAATQQQITIYSATVLPHFSPMLQTQIYLAVVANSYLLGLLAGKAHGGSLKLGLLDAAIATTIATITLLVGGTL